MNHGLTKLFILLLSMLACHANISRAADQPAYKESPRYLQLRDSMHNAFNTGDSTRFFKAVGALEDYLLEQDDLHAYYTQRCNEIIFFLNRQDVFEAYKRATALSRELTERKLDKEMYMAVNMMGHIYRYSGNKETAKECFWDVIHRMEQEGYTESIPPIYMNLVNIYMDEDPAEALRLIDRALAIAQSGSPERVFDIEARRTLAYYNLRDTTRFLEGYNRYREGVAEGLTSVHGRRLDIDYQVYLGHFDEALSLARQNTDDPYETMAEIYATAGRWKEAYDALKLGAAESDSINSIILSSSMQGIQNELRVYETQRHAARIWFYSLAIIAILLLLLVVALVYIVQSRRRHLRELKVAYQRVVDSDKMKTAFIQNVSHEVRTPLNIISGFAQVIANQEYHISPDERSHIAHAVIHNTRIITTMIDEVLEMSVSDPANASLLPLKCDEELSRLVDEFRRETHRDDSQLGYRCLLPADFTIQATPNLLRRIVTPLIDNALKFCPDGPVTITAEVRDNRLQVAVEDTGCGIPAEDVQRIFDRFVKLDDFKEGLGLGLTFSRTLARRAGGDVVLDTDYGPKGARFVVTL